MTTATRLAAARASIAASPMARTAAASLAIRMGGMALFFGQAVLFARLLGPERYGELAVVLAAVELAAVFALAGFGISAIREVPRLGAAGDAPGIAAFWRVGAATILAASLLAMAAIAILAIIAGQARSPLVWLGLGLVPALALAQFARGMVQGNSQPLHAQWPGEVLRPALVCLALAALAAMPGRLSSAAAMGALLTGGALALLVALAQVRPILAAAAPARAAQPGEAKQWRREALPMLGTALTQMLHLAMATLLLGALSEAAQAGLFQPVARIAPLLLIPAQAAAMHFAPRIAALWEAGAHAELQGATRSFTRLTTVITALLAVLLLLAAPLLLLAFGPDFAGGTPMLAAVAAAQCLACAIGPSGWLLAMTGHADRQLPAYALALAVQAVLGIALIPALGAWGATIALCGAIIALPLAQYRAARRLIGIDSLPFARITG